MAILLRRLSARAHAVVPALPLHPLSRDVYAVGAVWIVVLTIYLNLSEFRLGYNLAYYALMLFATLINGDHYLTDVLAGCAIAAGSLWGASRLIGWQAGRAAGGAQPPLIPAGF